MKALVLAAGRGERVRPLTERIPKPMLEVGGHPLIRYVLATLKRGGVTEVVINVHHLAAEIERGLGCGGRFGMDIVYSPEPALFGTGGPLNALAGYFGAEPFVIANSDIIVDLDLTAMIRFHRQQGALATLALCRPQSGGLYSRIEIDQHSRVGRMRLLKSRNPALFDDYPQDLGPSKARALEAFTYCGVLVAETSIFELMPKAPPWSVIAGLFAPMVAQRMPVFGFAHRGYFRTVDDLESYHALKREFEISPPRLEFAVPT